MNARTRERVQRIADDLGYRPSRSALSLRSLNTRTIGLVATNLDNPIAIDHMRATIRSAFELGYAVLVADGQDAQQIQDAELGRMLEYRVDGLILGRGTFPVTPNLIRLVASGVHIEPEIDIEVLRRNLGQYMTGYSERTELDAAAATIAYRQLLELGHRRFAMFFHVHGAFSASRQATLEEALARAAIEEGDIHTIGVEAPQDCIGEVQALAAKPEPPTVIVAARGSLTPHILQGIQQAGLRIPRDVSFLGFGDSEWHKAYSPPLSVIRHDYMAAATRSLERLVARIEGQPVPEIPRRPSEFVARGSFGPAPRAESIK